MITAASCAYKRNVVGLIAGDQVNGIIEESEVRGFAKAVYYHHHYRPNAIANDLALIELEEPFTFSDRLQPACLPEYEPKAGARCYIAGWGMSSSSSMNVETHLLESDIIILSNDICQRIFGPYGLWDENEVFCAMGNNGEGSCHGDAGGPVMCIDEENQPILAGLQRKRSTCGGPFLVTKVNSYKSFVRSIIHSQGITSCGPPEKSFKIQENVKIDCNENKCRFSCFNSAQIVNHQSADCSIEENDGNSTIKWTPDQSEIKQIMCYAPSRRTPCGKIDEYMSVSDNVVVNCKGMKCEISCKLPGFKPNIDTATCRNKMRKIWSIPHETAIHCESVNQQEFHEVLTGNNITPFVEKQNAIARSTGTKTIQILEFDENGNLQPKKDINALEMDETTTTSTLSPTSTTNPESTVTTTLANEPIENVEMTDMVPESINATTEIESSGDYQIDEHGKALMAQVINQGGVIDDDHNLRIYDYNEEITSLFNLKWRVGSYKVFMELTADVTDGVMLEFFLDEDEQVHEIIEVHLPDDCDSNDCAKLTILNGHNAEDVTVDNQQAFWTLDSMMKYENGTFNARISRLIKPRDSKYMILPTDFIYMSYVVVGGNTNYMFRTNHEESEVDEDRIGTVKIQFIDEATDGQRARPYSGGAPARPPQYPAQTANRPVYGQPQYRPPSQPQYRPPSQPQYPSHNQAQRPPTQTGGQYQNRPPQNQYQMSRPVNSPIIASPVPQSKPSTTVIHVVKPNAIIHITNDGQGNQFISGTVSKGNNNHSPYVINQTGRPNGQSNRPPQGQRPTTKPVYRPTTRPTYRPTTRPTTRPTLPQYKPPTTRPPYRPTTKPTYRPTTRPTYRPTTRPTTRPIYRPTTRPTTRPTYRPTTRPAYRPTTKPTYRPTTRPTYRPQTQPTYQNSNNHNNHHQNNHNQPAYHNNQQHHNNNHHNNHNNNHNNHHNNHNNNHHNNNHNNPYNNQQNNPQHNPSYNPNPTKKPVYIQTTRRPTTRPYRPTTRPKVPSKPVSKYPVSKKPVKKPIQNTTKPPVYSAKKPKRPKKPSKKPYKKPSKKPSKKPTKKPIKKPSKKPSKKPTKKPYKKPTKAPSQNAYAPQIYSTTGSTVTKPKWSKKPKGKKPWKKPVQKQPGYGQKLEVVVTTPVFITTQAPTTQAPTTAATTATMTASRTTTQPWKVTTGKPPIIGNPIYITPCGNVMQKFRLDGLMAAKCQGLRCFLTCPPDYRPEIALLECKNARKRIWSIRTFTKIDCVLEKQVANRGDNNRNIAIPSVDLSDDKFHGDSPLRKNTTLDASKMSNTGTLYQLNAAALLTPATVPQNTTPEPTEAPMVNREPVLTTTAKMPVTMPATHDIRDFTEPMMTTQKSTQSVNEVMNPMFTQHLAHLATNSITTTSVSTTVTTKIFFSMPKYSTRPKRTRRPRRPKRRNLKIKKTEPVASIQRTGSQRRQFQRKTGRRRRPQSGLRKNFEFSLSKSYSGKKRTERTEKTVVTTKPPSPEGK